MSMLIIISNVIDFSQIISQGIPGPPGEAGEHGPAGPKGEKV